MSSFNPQGGNELKPWKARVSRDGKSYYLGRFATKEEADQVEQDYRFLQGWTTRLPPRPYYADMKSGPVWRSPKRPRTRLVPIENVRPR